MSESESHGAAPARGAALGMRSAAFRAMWLAELASVLGDQLAKVVIALLVYERTGSAAASGIAYGLTFLPPLLTGGMSGLADRFPRRGMLVTCYLVQGLVVAVMAVPGMPIPLLVVGAMLVAGIQNLGKAAQGPLVLDLVGTEKNKSARARLLMFREIGAFGGLVGAGAVVVAIGTSPALLVDALSFVIAALLVTAAVPHVRQQRGVRSSAWVGIRSLITDAREDPTIGMLWILLASIGWIVALPAVVVPYVAAVGAPTWAVGVLLAADSAGYVVGAWRVGRIPEQRQQGLLLPLAALSSVPLIVFAVPLPWWVAIILLAVSGAGSAYLPIALGELTQRTPYSRQGMVSGIQNVVVRVSQGIAAIIVGLLAQVLTAAMAVALAGVCGVAAVGGCALSMRTSPSPSRTRREVEPS